MGLPADMRPQGQMSPGARNLISDVPGVLVGHRTLAEKGIQTGVTVVLPHAGNLFREKVPAASHVINGFGKSAGLVQVDELGTIETPLALTNTFGVGTATNALIKHALDENPEIGLGTGTVNPLALECNDGWLNTIRSMPIAEEHVLEAIADARGDFSEGAVGAGRGMTSYGLKGGIGSASRTFVLDGRTFTLGALLLTNFGKLHDLSFYGRPIGRELEGKGWSPAGGTAVESDDKGSCIVIVATDLPLSTRQLKRLARRAQSGIARTGSVVSNGSGEIVVAFSTASTIPHFADTALRTQEVLVDENALDVPFRAVTECVEESVLSALVHAKTVTGRDGHTRSCLIDALERAGCPPLAAANLHLSDR